MHVNKLCAINLKPTTTMFSIKNNYHIIIAVIIYEIIRHFFGTIFINWSSIETLSDTQLLMRNLYNFWPLIDVYIAAFIIIKYSVDEKLKIFINRIKLIAILIIVKWLMVIILNTINPTNRIISSEEWISKSISVSTLSIIQVLLGILIFYFIKPKSEVQLKF